MSRKLADSVLVVGLAIVATPAAGCEDNADSYLGHTGGGSAGTAGTGAETAQGGSGSNTTVPDLPCSVPLQEQYMNACDAVGWVFGSMAGAGGQAGWDCTIDLETEFGEFREDGVTVALDCVLVPHDASDPWGWEYSTPDSISFITLGDTACEDVREGRVERIDILLSCVSAPPFHSQTAGRFPVCRPRRQARPGAGGWGRFPG